MTTTTDDARALAFQMARIERLMRDKGWPRGDANLLVDAEDALRDLADAAQERDRLAERVQELEAALRLYSCRDGCNDCPADERNRVDCGWTARAALGGWGE